jgi:hypothetical protein
MGDNEALAGDMKLAKTGIRKRIVSFEERTRRRSRCS